MRYTEKQLGEDVDEFNRRLAKAGALKRFHHAPRNGWQAVDEHDTDKAGTIDHGRGCYHVGSGTPREVLAYTQTRFYQIINAMD